MNFFDEKFLDRTGLSGKTGIYGIFDGNGVDCVDDNSFDDGVFLIDNSRGDGIYEVVDSGYHGIEGYLNGDVRVMEKGELSDECIGIYDSSGMYKMESSVGCTAYFGKDGKSRCVAFPQFKLMNSTVMEGYAKHSVFVGNVQNSSSTELHCFGDSLMKESEHSKNMAMMSANGFCPGGRHVPFDYWCVVGAVYGKALRIWKGVKNGDKSSMDKWIFVTISEIYECMNPRMRWSSLSSSDKLEWRRKLVEIFRFLNDFGMGYDLPSGRKSRKMYGFNGILENTWVYRRVDSGRESECISKWGDVYEPFGFKVRLSGSPLFEYCWGNGKSSPRLVEIRHYDYDCKSIYGNNVRGWTRCFATLWMAWMVSYRNYWIRKHIRTGESLYASCRPVIDLHEFRMCFADSAFEIRTPTSAEIGSVLKWYSVKECENSRRKAHIGECREIGRCKWEWDLPSSLRGKGVGFKDNDGRDLSQEEAGMVSIPADAVFAQSRMNGINSGNAKHNVVDGKGIKVDTDEIVLYKLENRNGAKFVDCSKYGRCYSMGHGVQCLKKAERALIRIDGRMAGEADYNALHPNMLYAMNGISSSFDMYDAGQWWRSHGLSGKTARNAVKMMLLILINAKGVGNALHAFKYNWNEKSGKKHDEYIPWLMDLYEAVVKRHSAISHEFCTGKGVELMALDGKLIREVMWRMTRLGRCVLGIHDSVITDADSVKLAEQIMQEEYEKMFSGYHIEVKRKYFGNFRK